MKVKCRTMSSMVCLVMCASLARAQSNADSLDMIALGDADSESHHSVKAEMSEVVREGLGESARRLLPMDPPTYHGGTLTFTVRVDPEKQNYLTAKFWGSDKGEERGELALFAGNQQIGYRSEGDYDVLNHCDSEGQAPGRFVYQTSIIPLGLTKGKTSIELTIRSFGPVWWYGPSFDKFQKPLAAPSRGIYRLYTHTNTRFEPSSEEKQGKLESRGIRPSPGEEIIVKSKQIVIDRIQRLLDKPERNPGIDGAKKRDARIGLLAEAYHVSWTPAYKNPKALEQIVADCDDSIRCAVEDPKAIEGGWLGISAVGGAVLRTWPELRERMGATIDLGVDGATTRGAAWAKMLRKHVDYWRTHRRGYTNQSQIVDFGIYCANRGVALIQPDLALPEDQARRYLYEAVGLEPWQGSDSFDSKDVSLTIKEDRNEAGWRFGDTHKLVTDKGLSREVGYVGTYGETILTFMREMVDVTGDEKIREQLRKIQRTRFWFRYPALDADGYQSMKLASEIDNRTAHYPKPGAAYNASEIGESWWMEVPAMFPDDPQIIGAAQQSLQDNQYFRYIDSRLSQPNTLGMMRNVDEYERVKAAPPSPYRLPMTEGQPDFVFADEQDGVVVIKDGQTRLFVNLYYRSFYGINGVARVLEVSPTITRLASVKSSYKIEKTIGEYVRPNFLHSQYTEARHMLPPDVAFTQALAGERLPIAAPPHGVAPLKAPAWGPFAGKADFYELRWGPYFIVMNTTAEHSFFLTVPAHAASLTRAALQQNGGVVSLPPRTTVVFHLEDD